MGKPQPRRYNSRELTNHLRELAAEVHDWVVDEQNPEGVVITKGEALARLLFKKALGYTERVVDDEGNEKVVVHRPEAWAIQLVYDRLEGKTPTAVSEDENRIKAADRVSELAKKRLNALAGLGTKSGPPKFTPKKKDDA